jgi:transcriptional regulator with PAS, ATPase and Fis domain
VLAVDTSGQVWGASPAITQWLATPQQLLGQALLSIPGLRVEGWRAQPPDDQPYELVVTARERGLALRATVLPVRREQRRIGSFVVLHPPQAPQPPRRQSPSQWQATHTFADLIGRAPTFQHCLNLARRAAPAAFPILLLGESGTGKEMLAQAIHTASPRSRGPFVAVNCGAGSDELLSADLFGYATGAFTGAAKGGRKGKVELARGGTLFLDEVEAMSPKMQVSLLRVLEENQVTPVGAEAPVAVDVRVIAAANEDLRKALRHKHFRLDLYHRLAVFPLILPPLRERREDVTVLVGHLLAELGFAQMQPTAEALTLLRRHAWPGNVRELKNVLLRAAHLAEGDVLTPAELPEELHATGKLSAAPPYRSVREMERDLLEQALADTQGNVRAAAARLGLHRATLHRKLKQRGLRRPE